MTFKAIKITTRRMIRMSSTLIILKWSEIEKKGSGKIAWLNNLGKNGSVFYRNVCSVKIIVKIYWSK